MSGSRVPIFEVDGAKSLGGVRSDTRCENGHFEAESKTSNQNG